MNDPTQSEGVGFEMDQGQVRFFGFFGFFSEVCLVRS